MYKVLMTSALINLLKIRAVRTGVDIKLASGAASNVYVDCKQVTLHGPSLKVLGKAFWGRLKILAKNEENFFVAGVSIGGDPLVAAILLEAAEEGRALEGLLIRKEPKPHGASKGKAVDGFAPRQGFGTYLVEDVITSGGSSKKAADYLRNEGYELKGILAMVDRQAGGVAYLQKELGIVVETLTTLDQLFDCK